MVTYPPVEFYHFKSKMRLGPTGSGEGYTEAKANRMPVDRSSLTKEEYGGFVDHHYDVIIDNEEKIVWVWLPVTPRGSFVVSEERVRQTIEEGEHLSLGSIAEMAREDDLDGQMDLLDYEHYIVYKGEEPDKFWSTLDKPSTLPESAAAALEAGMKYMERKAEKKAFAFKKVVTILSIYLFAAGALSAYGYLWFLMGVLVVVFFWWASYFILHWYQYRKERSIGAAISEILVALVMQAIPFVVAKFKGWGLGLGLDRSLFPLLWVRPCPILWISIFHTAIVIILTWWYVPKKYPSVLESF